MSQNFNQLVSGMPGVGTPLETWIGILNNNFAALASGFAGPSAPPNPVERQSWIDASQNPPAWMIYDGQTWVPASDLLPAFLALAGETAEARGSAPSLGARMDAAHNPDGTLKSNAPAGSWWTADPDGAARVSDKVFVTAGDKRAIYVPTRAVRLIQSEEESGHVVRADYDQPTDQTSVEVSCAVGTDLGGVEFGQPVGNSPSTDDLAGVFDKISRLETNLAVETFRRMIADSAAGLDPFEDFWADVFTTDPSGTSIDAGLSSGWVHRPADQSVGPLFAGTDTVPLDFNSGLGPVLENVREKAVQFVVDAETATGCLGRFEGAPVNLDAGPATEEPGGKVGLPCAGHGFAVGEVIEVRGTNNYDGTHLVDGASTPDKIVITAAYLAEEFISTESASQRIRIGPAGDCVRILEGCRVLFEDGAGYSLIRATGFGHENEGIELYGAPRAVGFHTVAGVTGLAADAEGVGLNSYESFEEEDVCEGGSLHHVGFTVNPANCFDGNEATYGATSPFQNGVSAIGWIFDQARTIWKIRLRQFSYYLTSVRVQAYDGANWSDVQTFDGLTGSAWLDLVLTVPVECQGIRLVANSAVSGASNWHVCEIEMFEAVTARPVLNRYTVLTPDGVDCSNWSSLNSIVTRETLGGAEIHYCLSLDMGASYTVWTGSVWRKVASSLQADHGGADGAWFYRDGADGWFEPYADNPNAAVSQAVEAAQVNRMSGPSLSAIAGEDLAGQGGWSEAVQSIGLGATLYTPDAALSPLTEGADFGHSTPTTDCDLVFVPFETDVAPGSSKAVFVLEECEGDSVGLNTDLTARASTEDGAEGTWVELALEDVGLFGTNKRIIQGEADFTPADPEDRTTRLRLTSANGKRFKIHAAAHLMRAA